MKSNIRLVKSLIINMTTAQYFPFMLYALLMLIFHLGVELGFGDDIEMFKPVLENGDNLWVASRDFLIFRYQNWSSRIVIESALIFLVHCNLLWRILDTIIMVWIAVAFSILFNRDKKTIINWLIVALVLAFPMETMRSAGWIATTANYSWPVAMGLLAVIPMNNAIYGKRTKGYIYVISIVALLYATNQEQMCAVILAISGFILAHIWRKERRISWIVVFEFIISILSLLFILTCPGNAVRAEQEVIRWFPDYPAISFVRKIELGYSSALFEFIFTPNLVFSAFCAILFGAVCAQGRKSIYHWIAAIPLVVSITLGLFGELFAFVFPYLSDIGNSMTQYGTGIKLTEPLTWIPDIFITCIAFAVLIALWGVYEDKQRTVLPIYLLFLGLATRWVMAFSPTVWASSKRTYIFMYFSIIAVAIILFKEVLKKKNMESSICFIARGYMVVFVLFIVERYLYYLRAL